jgi:hypothetical protein
MSMVLMASPASATATSGYIYKLTTGPYGGSYVDNCLKADIVDVADNRAWIRSAFSPNHCGAPVYWMPSGYLGIRAWGYRDGFVCTSTGFYYNSSSQYEFGVGAVLCGNPAGSQVFHTSADAQVWTLIGGSWQYTFVGSVSSPNQNY